MKPKSANAQADVPERRNDRLPLLKIAAGAIAAVSFALAAAGVPYAATAPTPPPANTTMLPLDSSLFFVLDDTIDSRTSKAGSYARAHLRDALVVNGATLAPAGSPVEIEVVQTQPAQLGNVDGSVEIYFEPLKLADGKKLMLTTPTEHIDPHMSSGQSNTRNITDTVGDIFVPYHYMYHILRKGQQVNLRPGTVMRARTADSITVANGAVVLASPQPFSYSMDKPQSHFAPVPLATPRDDLYPTPKPRRTPSPSPVPSAPATPSATPTS